MVSHCLSPNSSHVLPPTYQPIPTPFLLHTFIRIQTGAEGRVRGGEGERGGGGGRRKRRGKEERGGKGKMKEEEEEEGPCFSEIGLTYESACFPISHFLASGLCVLEWHVLVNLLACESFYFRCCSTTLLKEYKPSFSIFHHSFFILL